MEFKKKTIIGEDNNEPPKDYIGIKSDGKAYEYSYSQRKGIESKSINGSGNYEPVEANPTIEDGDVTIPLNALKVGESVYTVGCSSDSDIQIVELTYDHIPETGTLSASDLAKLDSDNCLLVMNGKYFRKTFSSDGGIDYKEIGLTTVLGGVRSIYFTVSKPDGEYTIAYERPIEANTQTQATTALENIKVGNTTYSIPLTTMIVNGEIEDNDDDAFGSIFKPALGSPSQAEAVEHFKKGGTVIVRYGDNYSSVVSYSEGILYTHVDGDLAAWFMDYIEVNGVFYPNDNSFKPNAGAMPFRQMKHFYDAGVNVYFVGTDSGGSTSYRELVDEISFMDTDFPKAITENGFMWDTATDVVIG